MKQEVKWYNKPRNILIATPIGAIVGGILGVFAYRGGWLG